MLTRIRFFFTKSHVQLAGKTLRECLWLYFLLKERTFCGSRPYNSEPLESMLKEIFGDMKMSDLKHPKYVRREFAGQGYVDVGV